MGALLSDASTASFVPARIEEILEAALGREREEVITRLMETLAAREAEIRDARRSVSALACAIYM